MSKFVERLRLLKEESDKTQNQIAADIGVTPQAFSYFMNGREPSYDILMQIANYYGVSVDWILGNSDVRNTDISMRKICETTGLSEGALNALLLIKDMDDNAAKKDQYDFIGTINVLIEAEPKISVIPLIGRYLMLPPLLENEHYVLTESGEIKTKSATTNGDCFQIINDRFIETAYLNMVSEEISALKQRLRGNNR